MTHQSRDSRREPKLKRFAIQKIAEIAKQSSDSEVKYKAIDSIEKIATLESDKTKKSYFSRFIEPVALSLFSSFLWEKGIKRVAAWLAATFLPGYMIMSTTTHVACTLLL
jgi:hypothetical protein